MRLQTQSSSNRLYNGTVDCLVKIVKNEGSFGLFKGMTSPLIGVAMTNAFLFGVYGSILEFQSNGSQTNPTLSQIFWAGCGSGLANAFISCPTELAKIQLQNQINSTAADSLKGPWDCLKKIYKASGIRGCYRGMVSTLWRETPSYGVYFASYELLCRQFAGENSSEALNGMSLMLAGGLSGIFGWLSSYPFDVIKTKIQAQGITVSKDKLIKGTIACFKEAVKQEGISVLFRGMNATIIRAFPTNAVIFLFYSTSLRHFRKFKEDLE